MKLVKKILWVFFFIVVLTGCSGGSEGEANVAPAETETIIESVQEATTEPIASEAEVNTEEPTEAYIEPLTEKPTEAPIDAPTEAPTAAPTEAQNDGYSVANETVYAIQDVNVRSGPGTSYDRVGQLTRGQEVIRTGENDGWSEVIFEGQTCYVSSKYLTTTKASSETQPAESEVKFTDVNETVYATQDVNVRSGPGTSYEKVGTVSGGESLTRTGIGDNGWSRVIYKNSTCYISSKYLSTAKPSASSQSSQEEDVEMVWVSSTGKKYHSKSSCSNMKNPSQISKETAVKRGLTPCKKCY